MVLREILHELMLREYYMSFGKLEKNSKSLEMKKSYIQKLHLMKGLFLKLFGNPLIFEEKRNKYNL